MKILIFFIFFIINNFFVKISSISNKGLKDVQEEKKINKTNFINVFIIPHTHDDVGWLLSVDQYYIRQVQFILDSCIQQLLDNPERKFTYVEIAYFSRWWNEITEKKKDQVRQLVKNGQLEFNLGGMTMNDEAVTTYYEEINQMTEGARFLLDNLGAIPQSAWHVDPFGHSAVTASLWSQIGFSAFGLNRIPYWIKEQMKTNKGLEFVWRGSKSLGKQSDIWVHVLDTWYSSPDECAFNRNDGWNGIYVQDDPKLFDMNVKEIADNFVKMVKQRSSYYRHNNLLIPFGDDFAHREAYNSFINMDKLIKYVNSYPSYEVNVQYAFLSDYVKAVNKLNLTWPIYYGDFFTYNDNPESYWSGYFTSRPFLKGYVRSSDTLLNAAEELYVFSKFVPNIDRNLIFSQIQSLRLATTIATHHDAITGTEKKEVANDYKKRLDIGRDLCQKAIQTMASSLLKITKHDSKEKMIISVFNQLAWKRNEFISLLLNESNVYVTNNKGNIVPSQINRLPFYQKENAKYQLFFLVNMEPLSLETFTIHYMQKSINNHGIIKKLHQQQFISNEYYQILIDNYSGRIKQILDKKNNKILNIDQNFFQYIATSSQSGQPSGAYIFRPETNSITRIGNLKLGDKAIITTNFPKIMKEIPFIIISPHGSNYNDTFALTIRTSNTYQFTINVYRLGFIQEWEQDLYMDYISWTKEQIPLDFQMNTIHLGSSTSYFQNFQIQFKSLFSEIPIIITTPKIGNVDHSFAISTSKISNTGFDINVLRVDSMNGWNENLELTYLAVLPNLNVNLSYLAGSTIIDNSKAIDKIITILHPTFTGNPIILVQARTNDYSSSYGVTVKSRNSNSFKVVIKLLYGSWSQNLQLDWVILPRKAILDPVIDGPIQTNIIIGTYIQEIQQFWKTGYAQTIRLYSNTNDSYFGKHIEINHNIGTIDFGKELITSFQTDINNQMIIYTDDNGLEMQKRIFNYSKGEIIAGNYFPMVSRSFFRDETKNLQFTLLSDSTHGCAGIKNGQIEIMLQRRCISDDWRGVGEVLNETLPIQPSLWLIFDNIIDSTELQRRLSLIQQFPMSIIPLNTNQYNILPFIPLKNSLPFNIHLLTFKMINSTSHEVLLRLQHIFEINEHPIWSKPTKINLNNLFSPSYSISKIIEMNLSGNIEKNKLQKLQWNTLEEKHYHIINNRSSKELLNTEIILNCMEIKTFIIEFTTTVSL